MHHAPLRLLLACLVAFLPSCVTRALWKGDRRTTQVDRESWTAPVQDGTLLVDLDQGQLWATLLPAGQPPVHCLMRPVPGFAGLEVAFPPDAATDPDLKLEITHQLRNGAGSDDRRCLLTVRPSGTMLPLEVQVVERIDVGERCRRYPIAEVAWDEVHYHQASTDVLGITWRVAATPFTVVTDAVLLTPVIAEHAVYAVVWPFQLLWYFFTTPPRKS